MFLVLLLVILFFLVKSYRDNYRHGYITFGQALGAGMIIFLYYSIISAIFAYILYAIIDPNLIDKQLAFTEELMQQKGVPQEALDLSMSMQRKMMKPANRKFDSFSGLWLSICVTPKVVKAHRQIAPTSIVFPRIQLCGARSGEPRSAF